MEYTLPRKRVKNSCRICGWVKESNVQHIDEVCWSNIHRHAYTCCGQQICVCGERIREREMVG